MSYAERCQRKAQRNKIKLDNQLNRDSLRKAIKNIKIATSIGETWVNWRGDTLISMNYVKKCLENEGFSVKDTQKGFLSIDWSGRKV